MNWFVALLTTTVVLRGFGAGIICGLALIVFPLRHQIDLTRYADYTRLQYKGNGVKVYVGTTLLGALLTLILSFEAFLLYQSVPVSWWIVVSLAATMLGFVGVGRAFPAMVRLRKTAHEDEVEVVKNLNSFHHWGMFSGAWHLVAFIALTVALGLMKLHA